MNYNLTNLIISIDENYLLLNIDETLEEGGKGPLFRNRNSFFPTRSTTFRYNYIITFDPKGREIWSISNIELINSDSGIRYFINEFDIINGKVTDPMGEIFSFLTLQVFLTKFTNI
jgi:hypothetical protein